MVSYPKVSPTVLFPIYSSAFVHCGWAVQNVPFHCYCQCAKIVLIKQIIYYMCGYSKQAGYQIHPHILHPTYGYRLYSTLTLNRFPESLIFISCTKTQPRTIMQLLYLNSSIRYLVPSFLCHLYTPNPVSDGQDLFLVCMMRYTQLCHSHQV